MVEIALPAAVSDVCVLPCCDGIGRGEIKLERLMAMADFCAMLLFKKF